MKTIALTLVLGSLALSPLASADILKTNLGSKKIENVALAVDGQTLLSGTSVSLAGAGLRKERVALINWKVYVAQLFVSDLAAYKAATPASDVKADVSKLNAIDKMKSVALQMTFVRGVDADTVMSKFRDALKKNNVNPEDAEVKAFLSAIAAGGDAQDGRNMTIVSDRNDDGTEVLAYEDAKGNATKIQSKGGLRKLILSIWLGQPTDGNLTNLKKDLISGNGT